MFVTGYCTRRLLVPWRAGSTTRAAASGSYRLLFLLLSESPENWQDSSSRSTSRPWSTCWPAFPTAACGIRETDTCICRGLRCSLTPRVTTPTQLKENYGFSDATVNGLYPGSHTTVLRNSTVSVFVTGTTAFSGDEYARVRVLRNGVEVSSQQFHTGGLNFSRTVSVQIPANCYIRVEVYYGTRPDDNQEPNWYGYCIVNPVFVGGSN